MLSLRFRNWQALRSGRRPTRAPWQARLRLEALEDRVVPTTYTVTNTNDSGGGSLRAAITNANNHAGADSIAFSNTIGSGNQTIIPSTALPTITDAVTIDGSTFTNGFIILKGASSGQASFDGLTITAANCVIYDLTINRFNNGITISGASASGNLVDDCYIGTNTAGTSAQPNAGEGIFINNAPNNTIGGPTGTATENLLSGNLGDGVGISGSGATGNVIHNNIIGLDVSGAKPLGNGGDGVYVYNGAKNNTIGGTTASLANWISDNAYDGVDISDSGTTGNVVIGNLIGTNGSGNSAYYNSTAIGNGQHGIAIRNGASSNTIGGTASGSANTVSGNGYEGIYLHGAGVTGNLVEGNLVGTDYTGSSAIANGFSGVRLDAGASNNTIGGTATGAGNVLSGNTNDGVVISDTDLTTGTGNTTGNLFYGNYIGTNKAGTAAVPNGVSGSSSEGDGFYIFSGTNNNTIGAGNVISGNINSGFYIVGSGTSGNLIEGCLIGTKPSGAAALGNGLYGVWLNGAPNNTVGGTGSASNENVISANGSNGVVINGTAATGNTVQNNIIGLDVSGNKPLGNGGDGVYLYGGASNNTIGGTTAVLVNWISDNAYDGVDISDSGTKNNLVIGNLIGTNGSGNSAYYNSTAIGNGYHGIAVRNGASSNTIGGTASGSANTVSGNGYEGIYLTGAGVTGNLVEGNLVGTNSTGTTAIANGFSGVRLDAGASNNTIGGTATGAGNVLSGNTNDGVVISDTDLTTGTGNTTGNVFYGNYIGTNKAGTAAIPNGVSGSSSEGDGFYIFSGTSGNTIGAGNVISGNINSGFYIVGSGTTGNLIEGCLIGTTPDGLSALANGLYGVWVHGSPGNTIGGTGSAANENVISGNSGSGVAIDGSGATGNTVQNNILGLKKTGSAALGNKGDGVYLYGGASGNTIGGTTAVLANWIGGNTYEGVELDGSGTSNNVVLGNLIGTDSTTLNALPNKDEGIYIHDSASNNTIGGTATGSANIVSGNSYEGVLITGAGVTGNVVEGNLIGTDSSGSHAVPNGSSGVRIDAGASNNTVGGTASGAGNVLSGNTNDGVVLSGNNTTGNGVYGNLIGLNKAGTAALPNGLASDSTEGDGDGVDIQNGAHGNTIGSGNVLSGNLKNGVYIVGTATTANLVQGSLIGTTPNGLAALGNGQRGVFIDTAPGNTIGGTTAATRNVLSGNAGDGVFIGNSGATGNVVEGNYVGVGADGTTAVPNGGKGIHIGNAANNNTIGGTASGAGNLIGANALDSVYVDDWDGYGTHTGSAGTGNTIRGNSILATGSNSGIVLSNGGNHNQAAPLLSSAASSATTTTISGSLTSTASTSFALEFFASSSGSPAQGNILLGNTTVTTNAAGQVSFSSNLATLLSSGQYVTATATNLTTGDTSAFSAALAALVDTVAPTSSVTALPAATNVTSIPVSWSGSDNSGGSGIASYDVYVSVDGGAFSIWQTATTQTSATYSGTSGHSYGFYSVATDRVGNRQPTPSGAQTSTLVDTVAPTSSVAALAAYRTGSFTVSWSGSDNSGGSGIASYDVYVSDNGAAFTPFLTATTQTSATFTGVNGHSYGFYSVATDKAGNRQPTPSGAQASTTVDTVAPTSSVAALAPYSTSASFTVSWAGSDNSGGSGIAGYDVYVSDNGAAFTAWQTATTQTSATYTGVNGHSYGFYSVSTDKAGNREATPNGAQASTMVDTTAPTSTVPALPAASQGSFTVSWSGSDPNNGSGIAGYDVYVSDNGGAFTIWQTATTQTSASYSGTSGHSYGFYSVATDKAGNRQPTPSGAQASTLVDTVAPTSTVTALPAYSTGSFTVSWSGSDNTGGSGIASYDVYVSDNGAAFTALLTGTTQTSATFSGTNGHSYGFYSVATDKAGNRQPTPSGAQTSTTVDTVAPTSSVAALAPYSTSTSIAVSWSGSDNSGGSGIASYDVYVSDNGGAFTIWQTATTQTSASYSGTNGHTYGFYSVATDKAGNRQPTPSGAQTSTVVDTVAPTSTVAALPANSSGSFTVSWSGSDTSGGSGIASYDVYVSSGGAFTLWQSATTQTSASYTGENGVTYGFYSVATDKAGNRQPTPGGAQASTTVNTATPSSHVNALPAFSQASFPVSWTGSAGTSGTSIANYSIYVSDNGGAFTAWQTATTQTSATYTGTQGHTYGFYSVATDNVGNVQPTPSSAQTSTTVDTVAPTSTVSALPSFSVGNIPVSWSGSDNSGGSGIAHYDVYVSDNGAAFTIWQTATTQTSGTYSGTNGHTYGFYSVATDNAGNRQPTPSGAQASTTVDTAPPTSTVAALPAFSLGSIPVSWAGSDGTGSGIAHYDVYVSDNGAAFTLWQSATTQTSATYSGTSGHSYGFYSVATDKVGNQQTASAAQASTTVDTVAPTSTVAALPGISFTSFTVSWSGSDNSGGSGIAGYDVYVSDNGGAFTIWQTATTQTSATYNGMDNHTYGFYSVATDKVGNRQATPSAAQASTQTSDAVPQSSVTALPAFSLASFKVSWSGSDGGGSSITGYSVYVSDNGAAFTAWQTSTTATSATYTGTNGHTYGFYSVATNALGITQPTPSGAQASTTVDTAAPTSSAATLPAFSGASFKVSWAGSDGTGSGVAGYDVYVSDNGAPFTLFQTGTTQTSATFTGVSGHSYGFYSVATDNVGNRQQAQGSAQALTTVDTTPPTSTVSALPTFEGTGSFKVSWTGSDGGNGSGIAGYDVYVSDNGGPFTPWQTATTQTSASYPGVSGHSYSFYSVAADNVGNRQQAQGSAQASTTVDTTAPTSTVAGLPAFLATTDFTVSWSGSDGAAGSGIASYDVYVSDNNSAFTLFLPGTTQTSATFTGVKGHSYGFYSVATDNVGNRQPAPGGPQTTLTIDTTPPSSQVATLPAFSGTSFKVSWSGSDGSNGSGIATYDVFVSDNGAAFTPFQSGTTQTSATFTGVSDHTYGFYSVATDNVGNVQPAPTSPQATTRVDITPPTSTVSTLPRFTKSPTFTVSWSGSDGAGSGIASYDVFVSDNGGPFTTFQTGTTQTSATFTGVSNHTYGFYVVATDNVGNRQVALGSAQATITVDATPPTSSVAALPDFSGSTSFTVNWSGSDGSNGSGIAAYDVYVSDNGGAFTLFQAGTTQTSATFTGVKNHTYGFYSVATDNVGNVQPAPGSAQASTTVDTTAPTSKVTALPAFSAATFTVSWSGNDNSGGSGIASYDVYVSDNGALTLFESGTTDTSATFTGVNGHSYGFYSVATDNVGNRQPTPGAAQATTTVDTTAPTSSVTLLPAFSKSASFTVSWSGGDGTGSGVAGYDVFVSVDGAAFIPWQTATTQTSATYAGQNGHSYGFYSVATDGAGNKQVAQGTAQATTTVDSVAPTSQVTALPAFSLGSFTLHWTGSDGTGSGIASYNVYVSTDGGAWKQMLAGTTSTSTTFTGKNGHSYGFYSAAIDQAGNQQAGGVVQAHTRVDTMPPTSTVLPLPALSKSTKIALHWSGNDAGSGVAFYDVYVRDNTGAFKQVLKHTTRTSLVFTGKAGHTYGFYSVATDKLGNRQSTPARAQATTKVPLHSPQAGHAAVRRSDLIFSAYADALIDSLAGGADDLTAGHHRTSRPAPR